jgi:hypothetical protein
MLSKNAIAIIRADADLREKLCEIMGGIGPRTLSAHLTNNRPNGRLLHHHVVEAIAKHTGLTTNQILIKQPHTSAV